jgi:hypothetical protein
VVELGILVIVLAPVALAAVGYGYLLLPGSEPREFRRIPSPDGVYDAVLFSVGGSLRATTSAGRKLYGVDSGEEAVSNRARSQILLVAPPAWNGRFRGVLIPSNFYADLHISLHSLTHY